MKFLKTILSKENAIIKCLEKQLSSLKKNQLMQIADKKNSKYIKEKLRLCQHNAKHSLFPLGLKHCFSSDKQVRG